MNAGRLAASAALLLICATAAAHPQTGGAHAHGFLDGLLHPLSGLDHLLAMLAVGSWSVRQSSARTLPALFAGLLLIGVISGMAGLQLPGLETGLALSVLLIGGLIALAARLPAPCAGLMVGVFALLHGNAHGHELPAPASVLGLLLTSMLLLALGRSLARACPALALKLCGAAIAATGLLLVAAA